MAKKVMDYIKLHIDAGKANPAPPVGPALGQRGVNIMEFTKAFNEKTKDKMGFKVPVVILFIQIEVSLLSLSNHQHLLLL